MLLLAVVCQRRYPIFNVLLIVHNNTPTLYLRLFCTKVYMRIKMLTTLKSDLSSQGTLLNLQLREAQEPLAPHSYAGFSLSHIIPQTGPAVTSSELRLHLHGQFYLPNENAKILRLRCLHMRSALLQASFEQCFLLPAYSSL